MVDLFLCQLRYPVDTFWQYFLSSRFSGEAAIWVHKGFPFDMTKTGTLRKGTLEDDGRFADSGVLDSWLTLEGEQKFKV